MTESTDEESDPMSLLSLRLLGPPRIELGGEPIQVDTRKAIALLAYIAVTADRHRRDALANLLWPESDRTHGRTTLRRTLYALRKALPGDWLDVDRESVGWHPHAKTWLDVEEFRSCQAECLAHGHGNSQVCLACLAPLTKAADLYRGDFMAGFGLKDSFNFDDWQFFQSEALRRECAGVLARLVRYHAAQGGFQPAIGYARQWLALDRLEEEAHRWLMGLYAWSEQRSAALRQYGECTKILESQLGVSPGEATTALFQAIVQGRVPDPPTMLARRGEKLETDATRSAAATPTLGSLQDVQTAEEPSFAGREEKRIITALYIDFSGSFVGRGDISPEAEAASIASSLAATREVLAKHGGEIHRTVGGSILAVFGTHQARESDAELALRAAIEIRRATNKVGLFLTAGVASGPVVAYEPGGQQGHARQLAGSAVDLAMHLAARASPGQILVGESTHRLSRRAFEFIPLLSDLPVGEELIAAYELNRLLDQPKKARGIEGLRAELVGRDEELAKLKRVLVQVLRGQGHMVSIVGEAGVGKSRLVTELREHSLVLGDEQPSPLWLEGRCLDLGTTPGYAPFADMLRGYLAWGARDADARRRERIVSRLQTMAEEGNLQSERVEEMAALLSHLLSLHSGGAWEKRFVQEDPEQIRCWTFGAIYDFCVALAQQQPVVLVFEDLHWADSLSLDLISLLMEGLSEGPLLLLCVYRPERERKTWHLGTIAAQKCRERYTEVQVRELSQQQSRQLVASLLGVRELPSAVTDAILDQSQGNPFYIEETVRSLIDAGILYRQGDTWRAEDSSRLTMVPESVQSVILSRVDRLEGDLRDIVQMASVIGRVFPQPVLERALGPTSSLAQALWQLEDRALVYQERPIPEIEYSFKHVLTQQTVYQSIPQSRREELHRCVAGAIETAYPNNLEEHYEELAYHLEQGGDVAGAIAYLSAAGEKARRSYANEEAIAHLSRGLELLQVLPDTAERFQRELDLLLSLGVPLVHTKGHAASEVGQTYSRARKLCERMGSASQRFQALMGLRRFHFVRGEMQMALDLGERLLALGQRTQDRDQLSRAHVMHAEVLGEIGAFVQAVEHTRQGAGLYDRGQSRLHVLLYGNDTWVGCCLQAGLALWHLGYPEQALESMNRGLATAEELSHPFTMVYALYCGVLLHRQLRQAQIVRDKAEALLHIARERGFALYTAWGTIWYGWALAELELDRDSGQGSEGMECMQAGIASLRAMEVVVSLITACTSLIDICVKAGMVDEGLRAVDEALELVDRTGDRGCEAELWRLKGELLLSGGDAGRSASSYRRALDVARNQHARSWELRAATSLGRLWRGQGKSEEARELLGGVYGWFSEGFETLDLIEAKALLEALR